MDEMKITTKLMRGVLSKLVAGALHKKLGCNIGVQFNEASASVVDGKAHLHLSVDAELDNSELMKLLKSVGLD